MLISDIIKRHGDEWLLIEVEKFDEDWQPTDGKLLVHSKDKNTIYEALLNTQGKNLAIEYSGKIPDDTAILI